MIHNVKYVFFYRQVVDNKSSLFYNDRRLFEMNFCEQRREGDGLPLYNIGNLIKHRREELGLSQNELSEGICPVPTLSRIENGVYPPTREHAQALLQRLGYSVANPFLTTGETEFEIAGLQYECRFALIYNDLERARDAFDKLSSYQEAFSPTDRQFYEITYIRIHRGEITDADALARCESALRLTHPGYERGALPKILTYEEITALNAIAAYLEKLGERDDAIRIWYHLKDFYEKGIVDTLEALRTQPMILYNLSKVLGLAGRYDECIEVCDEGIRIAKTTGRCLSLPQTMYNRAWSMVKRGRPEDWDSARRLLRQAYLFSEVMGNRPSLLERITEFLRENFNEAPPSF